MPRHIRLPFSPAYPFVAARPFTFGGHTYVADEVFDGAAATPARLEQLYRRGLVRPLVPQTVGELTQMIEARDRALKFRRQGKPMRAPLEVVIPLTPTLTPSTPRLVENGDAWEVHDGDGNLVFSGDELPAREHLAMLEMDSEADPDFVARTEIDAAAPDGAVVAVDPVPVAAPAGREPDDGCP